MRAAIFGPEILILLFLVVPALGIWVAIDAGSKPPWAFDRIGQNKTLWVVLPLVGVFFCGIVTVVAAIMWFASIRPKVNSVAAGASPSGLVTAQWSTDPLGHHELRYWNGTQWTEHVSDAGVPSTDPLEAPPA